MPAPRGGFSAHPWSSARPHQPTIVYALLAPTPDRSYQTSDRNKTPASCRRAETLVFRVDPSHFISFSWRASAASVPRHGPCCCRAPFYLLHPRAPLLHTLLFASVLLRPPKKVSQESRDDPSSIMSPSNGRRGVLLFAAVALAGAAVGSVAAQDSAPKGPGPSYFDPKNFNPSMAIVMVVLVTAFFLLGFFSIYLRRCAGPPLGGPDEEYARRTGGGGIPLVSSRRAARGLDRAVLDSFPTMAYADVKAHKAGKGGLECAVCLSEFDDDDTLRLLPRCSHAFHADCIDAWLAAHVTCPVCRAVLVPDAESPPAPAPVPAATVQATEQSVGDAPAAPQQPPTETATAPPEPQVAVVVVPADKTDEEEERIRREEAAELMRIGSVKRALRSKSGRRPAQLPFPRSHTTGHSLALPSPLLAADSAERYTLRLPEHVLQEVVAASRLRRSASAQAFRTGARRGFFGARSGRSVRLGQSGRWPNMSVLARTLSARLPVWGSTTRRGEVDAPAKDAKVAGDGRGSPLGGRV